MYLNKLSIRARLYGGFGIMFLLLLTLAFLAANRVETVDRSLSQINDVNSVKQRYAINFRGSVHDRAISLRDVVLSPPSAIPAELALIEKLARDYADSDKKLDQMLAARADTRADEKAAVAQIKASERLTLPLIERIVDLRRSGNDAEAIQLLLTQARPAFIDWLANINRMIDLQERLSDEQSRIASGLTRQFTVFVVALAAAALVLTILLAIVFSRSITRPLDALQKAIKAVRDGDSIGALATIQTQDEMAEIGRSVNELLRDQINGRESADVDRKKAEAENDALNNSIISILQAVNQLSQRDLTVRAPVTRDIIGTVSDSINALTDETSKVLRGVSLIAGQVEQASGQVKSQANLVSKTAEDERDSVNHMMRSLGEATLSMNQVAALAEQTNVSAGQATQATSSALETVNNTVKGMESIRETIAETEKRIKRLGERSQEITGIVNLINTISERTHVLALNASMQAAVAGEAGRGFAVVAEEVQRLAESSRSATQQIGTLVSNIQLETNETISTVNRTIGQVVQGSEQAQKAGEQMRRTQEITEELVAQVRRIAVSSEQQREMSAQLMDSVRDIGQSTERTAQQIDTQNEQTESLLESARQLVASVNVFKLPAQLA